MVRIRVQPVIIVFILALVLLSPVCSARSPGEITVYSGTPNDPGSHDYQGSTLFAKNDKVVNPHATKTISTTVQVSGQGPGDVTIGSSPAGAQVYFDGTYKGLTPLSMKDVSSGQHTVRLALSGYADYNGGVSVSPGKVTESVVTLTSGIAGSEPGFRWDDPVVLLTVFGIVTTVVGAIVTVASMAQTKKNEQNP